MAYLSYTFAEVFHFSGIVSIIGCGLVQAHYAFKNISKKSYTTVKYFTKTISSTSDCIIFLFLGIAVVKGAKLPNVLTYAVMMLSLCQILFCYYALVYHLHT